MWTGQNEMQADFIVLRQVLQYELHSAERYRRFVSLVMISTDSESYGRVRKVLCAHVRNSDLIAGTDGSIVVLMGETDKAGALCALDRYLRLFHNNVELYCSIVTYPSDGGMPDRLIPLAYRRLKAAKSTGPRSVVAAG